jgi:tetraacyldisaccharide 4'-kinase
VLQVISKIYRIVTSVRNYLYDKRVFEVHDLASRTISVGNITTGGTGKTPLVAYIASLLADRGEKVCVLTRGYGRADEGRRVLVSDGDTVLADAARAGDEPVELAEKLLGKAIVVADADRAAAAEWARRKFGVTTFLLDDGFQHRKVKRDIDIVCLDATNPFGGGSVLPSGRLREPVDSLSRASVIVITRAEQAGDISHLRAEIKDLAPAAAIFESRTSLSRVVTDEGPELDPASSVFAFCGVGNPESFFSLMEQNGYRVVETHRFRDHHTYTQSDVDLLETEASQSGACAFVTTSKDKVKLNDLRFTLPVYVAEISVNIDNEAEFKALF